MKLKSMKAQIATVLCTLLMALVMVVTIIPSVALTASADDDVTIDSDYCYEEGYDVSVNIGAEGSVLLRNEDNTLPLDEGTKVTLLGSESYNYVEGGTGSAGGADDENTVMMDDALEEAGLDVNATAWDWLEDTCGGERFNDSYEPNGGSWESYTYIHEFGIETYENAKSTILQSGYTDYAIVTFGRSGAEGASPSMDYDGDGSSLTGTTYLQLNDDEKDLLEFCAENFSHTIVLVNSAAAMELGFIESSEYNIDACIWIGHPGEAGITGVATVLSGRNNPSGALVDTYSYDLSTNPTYYNTDGNSYTNGQTYYQYEEGIYVGYRYYETADSVGYFDSSAFTSQKFKGTDGVQTTYSGYDEVVQFPFGYGMSYTTFTQEIKSSDVSLKAGETGSVTVTVTNTGDVAGKEIVQLYMEAPYNQDSSLGISGRGLEKSKVVLVGYAKTDIIEPKESDEVTITFDVDNLASYDNFGQGCYVLEKGTYNFNLQDNAHYWDADGENAPYDTLTVSLSSTIIYNEDNAGARSSDSVVAENALDDVTAGDGNMVDGYLSRSDMSSGMASIMSHESNCSGEESLAEGIVNAMATSGTDSYTYSYETYVGGEKTTQTSTIYAKGGNMMPFATETPDGIQTSTYSTQSWDEEYYVLEDENGDVITDDDGLFDVYTEDTLPSDSAYHKLSCDDMSTVPMNTEEGEAIWDLLANETSLTDAINVQGASGWKVNAIDSVGKAYQTTVDGPGEPANGTRAGATWFPCAVMIAATWNDDLAYDEGVSYGHQEVLYGIGGAYCPAMNIHRSPFGGRNFEYYSEDGFISGHIGGNAAAGIMSTGTNVFIKHFALNDGDTNRSGNTTWANEQAIREIYLLTYEISVKEYGADGIMGSLNRIGMSWYHYGMYMTILRGEWDFNGFLITDGDGSDGDAYNNPQAMLSVSGSMLHSGCYINTSSTVAAYGDATSYAYGQTMLHDNMKYCLYQYAGGAIGATSESSSVNVVMIVVIALVVVVIAAVAIVVVVVVNKNKKKKAA